MKLVHNIKDISICLLFVPFWNNILLMMWWSTWTCIFLWTKSFLRIIVLVNKRKRMLHNYRWTHSTKVLIFSIRLLNLFSIKLFLKIRTICEGIIHLAIFLTTDTQF